jgi:LysR family glycine cleavage system transcriptional activator
MVAPLHLRSLQAVELAARTGSLKAAAEKLNLTPAAVGQRVKALEDYLGIELFLRGRAGLIPTASLAEALPHLATAFRELERASLYLDIQRGHEMHIAAEPDFADLWLKPRLDSFRASHPNIAISVNGAGDAVFRPAPADVEIRFEAPGQGPDRLFGDFVLPICSPGIQRRLETIPEESRLEGFPLLHLDFYRNDPAAPDWRDWTRREGLARSNPERGLRFQRIERLLDAVRANAGLALCGVVLLRDLVAAGDLALPFHIASGWRTQHVFTARFRGDNRPHIRRFRDWLLAEAAGTRAWLDGVATGRLTPA